MTTFWDIGTDDATAPAQRADALVGGEPIPKPTRGGDITLEYIFEKDGQTTEYKTRYKNVRQYLDYAGSISIEETANYEPAIFENVPASASKPSVIVDFVPSPDISGEINGLWGAITGGEDISPSVPSGVRALSLDVVYLGELLDYTDRQAVKDELETALI